MMKWLTKGTSVELHTIGHHEVISIWDERRNDKYARPCTIIKFLRSFFFFFLLPPSHTKWSCSCGLFSFEHELCLGVGIRMWQTHKRARRAREQRGRSQTSELFLFVEIQKWSCYPGGSSCFPYSSATWQASTRGSFTLSPLPASSSSLSPLASSPTSRPSSLYPPTILLSPPAGKRSWPAVETAWLRRRPSRCTGDKFVCVSWAATLGGRTLTRSCQWEGKSRPSTSSAHLLLGRPPLLPILLSPRLASPAAQQGPEGRTGPLEPRLSSGIPDSTPGLPDTSCMHSRGATNTLTHTVKTPPRTQ